MKNHIKLYEEYSQTDSQFFKTREEIENWLDSVMNYGRYTIHDDLTVDLHSGVSLEHKKLKNIPVRFRIVQGKFTCYDNELTSLNGCPKVVTSLFDCSDNKLTSLEGCPAVGSNFICSHNYLTSLVFARKEPFMYDINPCTKIYKRLGFTTEAHVESILNFDPDPADTLKRLRMRDNIDNPNGEDFYIKRFFEIINSSPELKKLTGIVDGLEQAYDVSKNVEGDFY